MHKDKYAITRKFKYAKYAKNMQKYAKICSDPISISPVHSYALYAQNMQKYARYVSMKAICNICKNMHSPLCRCFHNLWKFTLQ